MGGTGSGRKKQPAQLAKLKGTYQACRRKNDGNLEGRKVGSIQAACGTMSYKLLTERQRKIYLSVCRQLIPLGILEQAYLPELVMFAKEFDMYMTAAADVEKNGMYKDKLDNAGNVCGTVENPSVRHMDRFFSHVAKIGSNFGLSPVDRQRIKARVEGEDPSAKIINLIMEGGEPDEQ